MGAVFFSSLLRLIVGTSAVAVCAALLLADDSTALALQFDEQAITQYARSRHGERAATYVGSWLKMLSHAQAMSEREQLSEVNEFWNTYIVGDEDINIWGKEDYWATP